MNSMFNVEMMTVILLAALATYATRIGGYILMKRFTNIPPRVEAGLNAVPVAVLTTLVAPTFFEGGIEVKIAMIAALIVGLRIKGLTMLMVGLVIVMTMRHYSIV